jgi:antitoxin component YwqK of YwqJK toxin-antitoxin module
MRTTLSLLLFLGLGSQVFAKNHGPVNAAATYKPVQQQEQAQKKINLYDKKKRRHGQWEFYWDDSTRLANTGEFRHGEQIGTWRYYNEDGSLQKIETKKLLSRRYKTQLYYPNGQLQKEGYARLKKDKEYISYYWYGSWKCYDEQGKLEKIEKYKDGEVQETVAIASGSKL